MGVSHQTWAFFPFKVCLVGSGVSCRIFSFSIWALGCSMRDLVPQPGIEPRPPALGEWSPSRWTTRRPSPEFLISVSSVARLHSCQYVCEFCLCFIFSNTWCSQVFKFSHSHGWVAVSNWGFYFCFSDPWWCWTPLRVLIDHFCEDTWYLLWSTYSGLLLILNLLCFFLLVTWKSCYYSGDTKPLW